MPERVLSDKQLSPELNNLTQRVIGACIAVHRALGPGLLESAYETFLCHELSLSNISFRRQIPLPLEYRGLRLESGYVMDMVVEEQVVVELKAVDTLQRIHEAQLLTYLKLTALPVGLLINFNVTTLVSGVKRFANTISSSADSASLR